MENHDGESGANAAVAMAFAVVLRELRGKRDLSQERLGFESGLHRTYISQLERGTKQPTLATIIKIAGALELRAAKLVDLVEKHLGTRA